jgi:phosphoribosylanthranilate isomerase
MARASVCASREPRQAAGDGVTRIKICGITCAEDAEAAARAGADAVGFVFAPGSPRRVTPETAAAIAAALPPFIVTVGVFADQDLAEIVDIVRCASLHWVQLHGAEGPEFSRALPRPVIRAVRVKDAASLAGLEAYPARAFLLDAFVEGVAGGTGQTFAWELLEAARPSRPIILAGGLTPANVRQAVRRVRPYAVDASSGLERQPGRKDHQLVEEFIANVRAADHDRLR